MTTQSTRGNNNPLHNIHGFTIIEVIAVLLIVIISSAVVASMMFSTDLYKITSETEKLKAHIRYAQSLALNSNVVWGIHFSDETHYAIFKNGNINDTVILPGEDSTPVELPAGVTVQDTVTGIISFDSWGKPYTDAAATVPGGANITVSLSGVPDESITVTQNTGFIP
ncbi:MAG: hypothetical protein A2073_04625 [Deltaproteobacteria bacterium GWC2_42_11]|nr:MAG: hypothetical protein A2073_04625 [Deltaproteobacteria bacterium GWC2_42_11]HBO83884.1 hypothetical protein [Deltaproteobacteria bacterium]